MMNFARWRLTCFIIQLIIYSAAGLSLYFVLSIIESQTIANPAWTGFLTWRLPLLLGVSSTLFAISSRHLHPRQQTTISRLDHATWWAAPIGVFLQSLTPTLANPQIWMGLFFLTLLALKSGILYVSLQSSQGRRPVSPVLLFAILLWFFSMHGSWYAPTHAIHGDEPHYLLMAHSLIHDGDLNLYNEYMGEVYKTFHPHNLSPKSSDFQSQGQIYSRGLGSTFPFILAPSYALGGHRGAQIFVIFCAALLITQLYLFLIKSYSESRIVLATSLLVASTGPILNYSCLIYPDILGALLIVLGLRCLQIPALSRSGRSVPSWLILISAALIFVKFRYFVPVLLLLGSLMLRELRKRRSAIILFTAILILGGFYFIADRYVFKGDLFTNRFGGWEQILLYMPTMDSLKVVPGLLLDQESGLLFHAPLYLLAFAGVALYSKPRNSIYWISMLGVPLTAISLLGHFAWHSLPTPPLRYLLPILPPTAIFIVSALIQWKKRSLSYRVLATLCITVSWIYSWIFTLVPRWQINIADGASEIFSSVASVLKTPVPMFFPSTIRPGLSLWPWLIALLLMLSCFVFPFLRDSKKPIQLKPVMISCLVCGALLLALVWVSFQNVSVYHLEDSHWVSAKSGTFFPVNRDPFFHRENIYGRTLTENSSVQIPLQIKKDQYNVVVRARLTESCIAQKIQVHVSGQSIAMITVTSKNWTRYAVKLPTLSKLDVITLEAHDSNDHPVAVDSIQLIRKSPVLFDLWIKIASLSRAAGWNEWALESTTQALLRSPGDPWYELRKHFLRGAMPVKPADVASFPLPDGLIDQIFVDAQNVGWEKSRSIEYCFGFSFAHKIGKGDHWSYSYRGILDGHQAAARLIMTLNEEEYPEKNFSMSKVIAYYLLGNTAKASELLDTVLIRGKHYPMQLTKPSASLDASNPFHSFFKDMENDDQYTALARFRCNRHLVQSVEYYHESDYKAAALHFDRLYLSDYSIFLDSIQKMSSDYVAKMFLHASRIHSNHTKIVIDDALQNHKPDIALAAATYGMRFNLQDSDFQFAKARAYFHQQDYVNARDTCLKVLSLHSKDDRSRWLLEQIRIRIRENSLLLGGFDKSPTEH